MVHVLIGYNSNLTGAPFNRIKELSSVQWQNMEMKKGPYVSVNSPQTSVVTLSHHPSAQDSSKYLPSFTQNLNDTYV